MNRLAADRRSTCPDREELADFHFGALSEPVVEGVAEHLAFCHRCASHLQELEGADSLMAYLQSALQQPLPDTEPECQLLEQRARRIEIGANREGTKSHSQALTPGPESDSAQPPSTAFGPYDLLERLGRGGMGVVYKAYQKNLKRFVALKMILAGRDARPGEVSRFWVEGEATARLRHPNVVQVYDFGEYDGRPYFSMELLEGGKLSTRLDGKPMPVRAAAELAATLARAMQAAHDAQILHRDLKPSNILFTADGVPKITDFGLAKLLDGDDSLTPREIVLGTASYMAPEQARGDTKRLGPLADVYALGATLYECLTGRPPFRGSTQQETLDQVKTQEPQPPSRFNTEVPRELEAICLNCLQKEPGRRYSSPEKLADDLGRWLAGQPASVRPSGWLGRLYVGFRRHPRVVVLVLLVLASVGALGAAWYFDPERPARAIEADLARGGSAELVGQTGGPRWMRWQGGGEAAQTAVTADGTFSAVCWSVGLLELVHDPRRDHFLFQAQVRHLNNDRVNGRVGIYFGHHESRQPGETFHTFGELSFDDIKDEGDDFLALPKEIQKLAVPPPPGNRVFLSPHLFDDFGNTRSWNQPLLGSENRLFFPCGNRERPWRTLFVEIGPAIIRAWWGDTPGAGLVSVGTMTTETWKRSVDKGLANVRSNRPNERFIKDHSTDFEPRAPLGLLIHNGAASFRNVRIDPLLESD